MKKKQKKLLLGLVVALIVSSVGLFFPTKQGSGKSLLFLNRHSYRLSEVPKEKMFKARVARVVDGDTVIISPIDTNQHIPNNARIRLVGVDTPETKHPTKKVEYFGREASAYTKKMLTGKTVYLAFDTNIHDKYNRLLCYVFTENGTCFNYDLVRNGYGFAYVRFPFKYKKQFVAAQEVARKEKKGMWQKK